MISRKCALAIANAYYSKFTRTTRSTFYNDFDTKVLYQEFYEFLYEREYEAWFCNLIKKQIQYWDLKDFLLKIHTGESFVPATKDWNREQRKKLGQEYLKNLAKDYIKWYTQADQYCRANCLKEYENIIRTIELDGYKIIDGDLLEPSNEVLNVEQEKGVLENLYVRLKLLEKDKAFEFLSLSELHYTEGRWSDCIGNSRKFFETVFSEVAQRYSEMIGKPLNMQIREKPVEVRQYLEDNKLLEKREREAVDKIYGLLSHTGGHPYMAESDQARLLRQISLLFTQFIMLRLEAKET
jgi:hypothetical protein